jgi:PEP-CTERM/exosortase A-associated glycosyltransferase
MSLDLQPVIVHVLDHALPELSGYSVRNHNVLRTLRRHGLPVVAMAPAADGPGEDEVDGVPYLRLPWRSSALGSAPRLLGLFADLHRMLAARPVSVLHAHTPVRTGLPALWAARVARVPIVYELHGLWEESAVERRRMTRRSVRYQASRRLETWLMQRVDSLAAISRGLAREAQRRGVDAERIFHVPNGVDTDGFRPRPADGELVERHGLQGKLVVGFIGFFFAHEGIDVLLRAFARLRAERPDARLLLVGDGDTRAELRAEVRRLALDAHVVMPGRVPHAVIQRYYSVCDVVAYPRRAARVTELVAPLRPLEAMAMGRAVVASDLSGLREIVRHGETGLLVPPDDADGLATALARLAADAPLRARLCEGARRFAAGERDWRLLAGVYAAAYTRLLEGRGGERAPR